MSRMHSRSAVIGLITSGLLVPSVVSADTGSMQAPPDFATEVRPILASRCFPCHGPDEETREAGLRLDTFEGATRVARGRAAVVPGQPNDSQILKRVVHGDPDLRMPPPNTGVALNDAEVDVLRRWILDGAAYTPHWAFEAPRVDAAPEGADDPWVRTLIDVYTLRRMRDAGLAPEPEADRTTLIRRVALDVTGLPPRLDDVDAYLADREPGAYERMVD